MKNLTYFLLAALVASLYACSKTVDTLNPADHTLDGDMGTFFLPMAITPNNDLYNDVYKLYYWSEGDDDEISSFQLEIKKGAKKLYSTQDPLFKWHAVDASGNIVSGVVDVKLKLGLNNHATKEYKLKLVIIRDSCVPKSMGDYIFGDMIDARFGPIYNTQETFCP